MSIRASRARARWRRGSSASAPAPTSPSSAGSSTTSSSTAASSASTSWLHERAGHHRRGVPGHRGPRRLLLGLGRDGGTYDTTTWQYAGMEVHASAGQREIGATVGERAGHGGHGATLSHGEPPEEDPTLEHPRCVFQLLKRHYRRYTPELVEEVCGVPREQFLEVARGALRATRGASGRRRSCYAVGWTQHTVGVQYIRAAAIIQLLLGNIGRPGGGIMALRGHASIQGSTDIPTLYNILPGYIPMPHAQPHDNLDEFIELNTVAERLLGATWGVHRQPAQGVVGRRARRRRTTSASTTCRGSPATTRPTRPRSACSTARCKGFIVRRREPGRRVGELGRCTAGRWPTLDWLVVRDLVEIETAAFWYDSPEVESGELRPRTDRDGGVLPAGRRAHREGRLVHEHAAAAPVAPQGGRAAGRLPLGAVVLLPPRAPDPREAGWLRATSATGRCCDLPGTTRRPASIDEPSAEAVLREINGWDADGAALSAYTELKDDGSTACGCWIYCGCYADETNQAARRQPRRRAAWVAPEWGWAWPANRRILYNRASADPEGRPWSERKRYVWWDEQDGTWTGEDVPDFQPDKRPDYGPPDGAKAQAAIAGRPPVHHAGRRPGLAVRARRASSTARSRRTTSRTSRRSETRSTRRRANPARQRFPPGNRYNRAATRRGEFPYVVHDLPADRASHGRRHEPVPAVPLRAAAGDVLRGQPGARRATGSSTAAGRRSAPCALAIEARVMVTERMARRDDRRPGRAPDRASVSLGQPRADDGGRGQRPARSVLDPNVHIQETKVATCDIRPGRRPRGNGRVVPR